LFQNDPNKSIASIYFGSNNRFSLQFHKSFVEDGTIDFQYKVTKRMDSNGNLIQMDDEEDELNLQYSGD
jgi:hypothetical protein